MRLFKQVHSSQCCAKWLSVAVYPAVLAPSWFPCTEPQGIYERPLPDRAATALISPD